MIPIQRDHIRPGEKSADRGLISPHLFIMQHKDSERGLEAKKSRNPGVLDCILMWVVGGRGKPYPLPH